MKISVSENGGRIPVAGSRSGKKVMNPFLDWSFKYLFGTEESKPNLIGFLNLLLMPQEPIVDIEFMNNEQLPVSAELKGCSFDMICKDTNDERYLIEMQNRPAGNIKERIIYYTCKLIDRMGQRGSDWDYSDIKKVYSICLMNFTYEENPKLRRDIQLVDINEFKPFSDKLNIILLQIPCLETENIAESGRYYEFLLYLLQEMHNGMKTIEELKREVEATSLPQATKELFYKVLDTADVASLSEKDRIRYESDLKNYRDTMSCWRYSMKTSREEGREERSFEIAKSMKCAGIEISVIAQCTNLPIEEIKKL